MGEIPHEVPQALTTAEPAHETSDVAIRPLAVFLAWLTGSLVAVVAICAWLFSVFEHSAERHDPEPPPLAESAPHTPAPLLQVSPRGDLDLLRERENRQLNAAEWVHQDRKFARIPIDQAMSLVVEHGLPRWPPAEGEAAKPGAADRAPVKPAASSPEGTGQTTPVQEGKQ
jgi:hypothetical protein